MCRWWKFAVYLAFLERLLTCCVWSQGWLYFISRQTRNWRTYFQGEKWQGTQMKNLLSWSRGDKVHCDYIDFKLLCRAGTSLCLVLLVMRRKEEGMNTPRSSASKYFVTSMITESGFGLLTFPTCKSKGVLASSAELQGDERRSEAEMCFSLCSLPLRAGCPSRDARGASSVGTRCLRSVRAPSSTRDGINRKQSMSEFDAVLVKRTTTVPVPQIITKLELIAINSTNIHLVEVLQRSHYCLTLCSLRLFRCQWENYSVNKS